MVDGIAFREDRGGLEPVRGRLTFCQAVRRVSRAAGSRSVMVGATAAAAAGFLFLCMLSWIVYYY